MSTSERRPLGAPSESSAKTTGPSVGGTPTRGRPSRVQSHLRGREQETATEGDPSPERGSVGSRFMDYARGLCDVFTAADGRVYGTPLDRTHQALPLGGRVGLVAKLALRFKAETQVWPGAKAQSEAEDFLSTLAGQEPTRPVYLRCAWIAEEGHVYVDTGEANGTVIRVTHRGWKKTRSAPVAFKRAPTTAPLQIAASPVDLRDALQRLRALVHVKNEDLPLVLALLLTTWLTGVPQPIVLITGPSDSGKTTMARFLLSLVDPTTHTRGGGLPVNEAGWKALSNTARALLIDNVGHITSATSDLLCRVSTGGELTTRALYTDDTAHVTDMQVPVWLTSVDTGVLREDLATRIVTIGLKPLNEGVRLSESELERRSAQARPIITRALLDLMVQVLERLPDQSASGLTHRMGDFEQVLRCVDEILDTDGVARLCALSHELGEDVLDSDPIAQAVIAGVAYSSRSNRLHIYEDDYPVPRRSLIGVWTPTQLLAQVSAHATNPARGSSAWPRSAGLLTSHLNRIAPTLLTVHGIRVTTGLRQGKARSRHTLIEGPEADTVV